MEGTRSADACGLPTFVGIGVPRAGTTWLHEVLDSHPRVWMPSKRKEVNFFDHDDKYERGIEWYRQFFPAQDEANQYQAIGEISPHYFYHERAARRLAGFPSVEKLVLTLRNLVERAVSQWRFWRRTGNYRKSFAEFVEGERGWAVDFGHYAEHLERYLEHWDREDLVVFVFEKMVANPKATKRTLADGLALDPDLCPAHKGGEPVNESFMPRFPKLNAVANRIGHWLRERDMYKTISVAKSLGVKTLLRWGAQPAESLEVATGARIQLWTELKDDVNRLESLLGVDLSHWGPGADRRGEARRESFRY